MPCHRVVAPLDSFTERKINQWGWVISHLCVSVSTGDLRQKSRKSTNVFTVGDRMEQRLPLSSICEKSITRGQSRRLSSALENVLEKNSAKEDQRRKCKTRASHSLHKSSTHKSFTPSWSCRDSKLMLKCRVKVSSPRLLWNRSQNLWVFRLESLSMPSPDSTQDLLPSKIRAVISSQPWLDNNERSEPSCLVVFTHSEHS